MIAPPKPRTRRLTILAQDPSIKVDGHILTAEVEIPAEEIAPGPRGYRVHVIDYDTSTNTHYIPLEYEPLKDGHYPDPYKRLADQGEGGKLVSDPAFTPRMSMPSSCGHWPALSSP